MIDDHIAWLRAKLEEAGLTAEIAYDAMIVLRGSRGQRVVLGHEYGHNVARLTGHELDNFAHAYADACEDEPQSPGRFWAAWSRGDYQPDALGRYHRGPWATATGTDG